MAYYTYDDRVRAEERGGVRPISPSRPTRRYACGQIANAGSINIPCPLLSHCEAPVKFFITNQEEDRRMRRAAAVEWTLAGVLFLLVAAVLAKLFHVL